jgi:chromosome segregation ATPase
LTQASAEDGGGSEQKHVEREIERLRRQYDDLRSRSARSKSQLDGLLDTVRDLDLDSQRPHMEDNEHTRRIRALENKLDKAMIKFNEAQSIRKTYEQIVKRLKEERVGFDNQLSAIERTLAAKQRDFDELMLLQGDANHAKEAALSELDRVRAGYHEERAKREKELRNIHQMAQSRRTIIERMKNRERMRQQLGSSGAKGSEVSDSPPGSPPKTLGGDRVDLKGKIEVFESAFRKIKEATGVSDVNEVIQKIISQESSTENLISLTRENQAKIESLNEQKRRLKARVEEVKYSGGGGGQRRKMVDDHEDQLANSAARLDRSRLKYERLCRLLVSIKGGVGHLQEKLEAVREEMGGKRIELTDDTVAELLRECEIALVNVAKRSKALEEEKRRFGGLARGTAPSSASGSSRVPTASSQFDDAMPVQGEEEEELTASRPFNQRIPLSLFDGEGEYGGGMGGDASDDESLVDEDELTRDRVKRASQQILQAVDRKKRKPKAGGAGGGKRQGGNNNNSSSNNNNSKEAYNKELGDADM